METFTTIKTIQAEDLTININKHCSNLTNNWWELEVFKADESIANFMVEEGDLYDTGYNLNCYNGNCDQDLIWDAVYFPLVHLVGKKQYFKTIKKLDGKSPYKANTYTITIADFVKKEVDVNSVDDLKDDFLDLLDLDLVEDVDGKYKYLAMPWVRLNDHEGEYAIWAEVLEDNTANAAKCEVSEYRYCTRDAEAGNIIDFFATLEEAQKAIEQYEEEDKSNGDFTPGFYEIYNIMDEEIEE